MPAQRSASVAAPVPVSDAAQAERLAPVERSIDPRVATLATRPAEGETIGYTGLAYSGEEFADHDYVSCPLVVGEHTNDGFYATVAPGALPGQPGGMELFVLLDASEGRQTFHGYQLFSAEASR